MKRLFFLSPLIFVLVFLGGCKPSLLVVQERPIEANYVQAAPGSGYIWHNADWIRQGNTFVFHKGFWIKPPTSHSTCVASNWPGLRTIWILWCG